MATYRFASKELSINNAKAFVTALNETDGRATKNSTILYAAIGKSSNWDTEPNAPIVDSSLQNYSNETKRNFIGAKKIDTGSVSHVTSRYDWESGTVYDMYRDITQNLDSKKYYVVTNDFNVYKCIYNNKGGASTVKPTDRGTGAVTLSDGYTWKYMYTISLGEAEKFMTSVHIPVQTLTNSNGSPEQVDQIAVQNAAVNGSIEVIETTSTGSGYQQVDTGIVETGGRLSLRISPDTGSTVSSVTGFYNGSSVYIKSGTGTGQLRKIVKWNGPTKTLTVNAAFTTTPNTDSRVIISPSATVIGDGKSAQAYTKVNTTTGLIANVSVINVGSGYTKAKVKITANSIHGSGATANVVISPAGGHGSDAVTELSADKICLNVKMDGDVGVSSTGAGYIPANTEFRSVSILKDPVLKVNSNNVHQAVETIANTSNSPASLRLTSRATISYVSVDGTTPVNQLYAKGVITNERRRLSAELGTLEFVTELGPTQRKAAALTNAVQASNAEIVYIRDDELKSDVSFYTMYINNVNGYGEQEPFVKDDVILEKTSNTSVATIESFKGPEANTFSGEILYTENFGAVTRAVDQTEDIKIILDF